MTYDKKCPICGKLNKHLDLKDSDGWMECSHCGSVVKVLDYHNIRKIPFLGVVH